MAPEYTFAVAGYPFAIAVVDTAEHRELCALFRCDKLLLVSDDVIGGITAGYAEAQSSIGLCFESGWAGDLTQVDAMRVSVEAILAQQRDLEKH